MRENTNITPPQKKNDKIRPIRTLQILDSFLIGYFSSTCTQLGLGSFMTLRLGSLKDILLLYMTRAEVIFRTYFIVNSYTFMEFQSLTYISNERYNIILAMHFRLIYFLTYKWLGSGMTISSTSTCDELGFYHILKVGYGLLF